MFQIIDLEPYLTAYMSYNPVVSYLAVKPVLEKLTKYKTINLWDSHRFGSHA